MGYELYREVKRYAPQTLTHREKLTAMILADDANDTSRSTWNSAFDPEIMAACMVKNDREMRKILARLQEEKIIEHAGGGHNGRVAKFRFLHLAPATVGGPERTSYEDPDRDGSTQKEPPTDDVGGPFKASSRSKKNLLTPSSPQHLSSPPAAPEPDAPKPPAAPNCERENSAAPDNDQAQQVAEAWTTARGGPRIRKTEATIAKAAAGLLADGHDLDHLCRVAAWMATRNYIDLDRAITHPDAPKPASATILAISQPRMPDWCGQCADGNPDAATNPARRFINNPDGTSSRCHCHPAAARHAA